VRVNVTGLDPYTEAATDALAADVGQYAKTNALLLAEVRGLQARLGASEAARADQALEIEVLRDGLSKEDLDAVAAELTKRREARDAAQRQAVTPSAQPQ
jgi:hypothetical protein